LEFVPPLRKQNHTTIRIKTSGSGEPLAGHVDDQADVALVLLEFTHFEVDAFGLQVPEGA
jgi:hypothetical protein